MAESNFVFQQIAKLGKNFGVTNQNSWAARMWFRSQVQRLTGVTPDVFMKSAPQDSMRQGINRSMFGQLLCYNYDPKTKDKLPYYDKFPVIFLIGTATPRTRKPKKGKTQKASTFEPGFYGLNLHYLPPYERAKFFDALYNQRGFLHGEGDQMRLLMTHAALKAEGARLGAYKHAFKKYVYSHVRSRFQIIPATQWDKVLFLPLARWERGGGRLNGVAGRVGGSISQARVHADVRRKLHG